MNLAIFTPGFPGSEKEWFIPAVSSLAEDLSRHALVRVFSMKYPERRQNFRWKGIPVQSFGMPGRRRVGPWRVFRAVRSARREHRRVGFDAAVALWGDESGLAASLFSRMERVPLALKLSGGELVSLPDQEYGSLRSPWQRFCLGVAARRAILLAVGSESQRENLLRRPMRRGPAPRVLPFGVDVDVFTTGVDASVGGTDETATAGDRGENRAGRRAGAFPSGTELGAAPSDGAAGFEPAAGNGARILSVGSLTRVKGFDLLLRALAALRRRHPGISLRLVGDGPERVVLKSLARELGLSGCVTWSGWVDHRRMPDVYRGADIFVSASRHEAQGLACLEAMACGLPVVGSATGTVIELLQQWGAGVLVSVADVEALERGLEIMLAHRQLWPVMGSRARQAVCERHSREKVLMEWRDVLETVAGGTAPTAPAG